MSDPAPARFTDPYNDELVVHDLNNGYAQFEMDINSSFHGESVILGPEVVVALRDHLNTVIAKNQETTA